MNEIFIGARVIYERKIYTVKALPSYCDTGWWVDISDGHFEVSTTIDKIIMPDGLNDGNPRKPEEK